MKVICISDPHGLHRKVELPEGDLLVCAGDLTINGELSAIMDFSAWLLDERNNGKFKEAIVIAGNHDLSLDSTISRQSWWPPFDPKGGQWLKQTSIYLDDSGVEVLGFKVWGSPIQPTFHDWAFNRDRGPAIREHWQLIPDGLDILITHGPPLGFLDRPYGKYAPVGCADLALKVIEAKPKLHVFGHIHGGYGVSTFNGTTFVNASVVNEAYKVVNSPIVIELEPQ